MVLICCFCGKVILATLWPMIFSIHKPATSNEIYLAMGLSFNYYQFYSTVSPSSLYSETFFVSVESAKIEEMIGPR